jgi:MoaA/NifB/PqqE/SkfB family radical SAM enzyme
VTAVVEPPPLRQRAPEFLWLDLTRKCQLSCVHCYNVSGPSGNHGSMTREDWISVLDQAAACGVTRVELIGGEPTLHPDAAHLVNHALTLGLKTEIFSNLVHVAAAWWAVFRREGVSLATSYYSDRAEEHNAMTGRPSHSRTRVNLARAVRLGIPLRVGIIGNDEESTARAQRDLEDLGVTRVGVDHVRPYGRGARDEKPDSAGLCGRCGTGRACISPNGEVSPCVFSTWMGVGNVHDGPLATILSGTAMAEANATIRSATRGGHACHPACAPDNAPPMPCGPDDSGPYPPSECSPRGG